jgi:exonuclease III
MKISFVSILFCLIYTTSIGQRIFLDESYADWQAVSAKFADVANDGAATGIDMTDIRISNDEKYLFLYLTTKKTINIQSNNGLTLFVDMDNNTNTGLKVNSIGAEISYTFGDREGKYFQSNGSSSQLWHDDIDLITLPTVTSEVFEIGLLRTIFNRPMASTIKILFLDDTPGGDIAGPYTYNFGNQSSDIKPFTWSKNTQSDIRFLSYNVLRDNLFETALQPAFKRIFNAIKPDVIGLCEIYDYNGLQTKQIIESFLPSTAGQQWYYAEASPDIRLVSRYPIKQSTQLDGNGVFLLDINGRKLLYIVAHLPCCDNESGRQREVDKIMSFVRDVKFGISSFDISQGSPIIIAGDMNLVGFKEQVSTFLTGDIINNSTFGPDFKPDWDDSSLEDAKMPTTGMPATVTWFNDFGSYSAGRLDYYIYTGSAIKLRNNFALYSETMKSQDLTQGGIFKSDVLTASDHTPIVADFSFDLTSANDEIISNELQYFIEGDILSIALNESISKIDISISTIDGKRLKLPLENSLENVVNVDLSSVTSNQMLIITVYSSGKTNSFKIVKN